MAFITSEGMLWRLRAACLVLLLPSVDATGTGSIRRAELRGAIPAAGYFDNDNPQEQEKMDQFTHEVSYWNSKMEQSQKVAKAAGGALMDAKYVSPFDDPDADGDPEDASSVAPDDDDDDDDGDNELAQNATPLVGNATSPLDASPSAEEHRAALRWATMIPDGGAGNFTALTLAAGNALHSDDDNVALAAAKALVQAETHVSNTVFEFNSSAVVALCDEFSKVVQIEEEIWDELRPMKEKETAAIESFSEMDDDYDKNSMALAEATINFEIKNNTVEYCRLNVQGEEWMLKEDEYEIEIDHQRVAEYKAAASQQRPHMFETAAAFREYKAVNNAYKSASKEETGIQATMDKSNSTIADMSLHCDNAEEAMTAERANLRTLQNKKRESLMEQQIQKSNLDLIQGQVLRAAIKLWRLKEKREALKKAIENMGDEAMKRCPEAQEDYSDVYTQGVGRNGHDNEADLPDGVSIVGQEDDTSLLETEPSALRTRWVPGGA